ncbi:hypothetical protein JVT61DRAFT_15189 [Boletus reticuloceps]|uniref:Uncharacterized protein n=1 Tax=Boletus reticuloceps TaxID=495285 RepID=A0A8I3A9Y9_9AGAM|nr:hypothetical protein JVT61DRAFT_15189 [Boletus reticuloceps]
MDQLLADAYDVVCTNSPIRVPLLLSQSVLSQLPLALSLHATTPIGVSSESLPMLSQFPSSSCSNTSTGISPFIFHSVLSPLPSALSSHSNIPVTHSPLAPAILTSCYELPRSHPFITFEISRGLNKVNHKTMVGRIIEHSLNAIVEYLETGDSTDVAVAYIFNINPNNFEHPQLSFQYSLGKGYGGCRNVTCHLLKSKLGAAIVCRKLHTKCK